MRVSNLQSPRSDRPVANQYEITDDNGVVTFQSYQTAIAKKDGYQYTMSSDWCYSTTTNKYFGQWLRGWGWQESQIADLKKWLKKPRTEGDEVAILGFQGIEVKYVEAL